MEKFKLNLDFEVDLSIGDKNIEDAEEKLKHEDNNTSLYGPVTSEGGADRLQVRQNKSDLQETSGLKYGDEERQKLFKGYPLNGFAMGIKREAYEKFSVNGWLFSQDVRDMWGCQEDEFYLRNKPLGLKSYIVHSCYIKHIKQRSWKQARERYDHPRRTTLNYNSELQIADCYK